MDGSAIQGIQISLMTAASIGKALLTLRDFNQIAAEVSKLNGSLLEAQQKLFELSASLLTLQQQHFEATQELRKAHETLAERGRYTLVELFARNWAYRVNVLPELSGTGDERRAQSPHYLCQPCFDKGVKSVLQGTFTATYRGPTIATLNCPVCGQSIRDKE